MKLKMNSGRKGNSSYTFSPMSLVTLDFGRLQPTRSFSTLLGDDFPSVKGKGLLRCTPQVFPPFGRMNVKSAAFFVPDSQIFSWSSAFHSDNKQWRGQIADSVPVYYSGYLNDSFANNSYISGLSTLVSSNPATPPARNTYTFALPTFTRTSGNTNLNYYKLTVLGWKFYAILKPLGMDFISFPTDKTASLTQAQHYAACSSYVSLVPFLCYCKIWNDYFCNSYQSDQNPASDALQKIYLNKDVIDGGNTLYNSSNFRCDVSLVMYLLKELQLPYETSMYTNAWNTPNDPTGLENARLNQINQQSLISPFGSGDYGEFQSLAVTTDRTTHKSNVGGPYLAFSQLGHRTLAAIDKMVRRRGLVGSKSVQQLYAKMGFQPDEWSKDYVVKLCETSNRVNFSAITSQADTQSGVNGKALGAFAGVGLCGYDLSFNYKANTYGTIVCVSWLNIDPIKMHGLSPDVLRVKPLDFYDPDFDGNAYRPIPYCEVTGGKAIDADGYNANSVYGFTNMYDDYRYMDDVVAGAFLDETTQHFAFMRDLTETRNNMTPFALEMYPQTEDVQYWHIDGNSDLTNPFITSPSAGDRFWFCIDWEIHSNRPILSPENSFNLDGEGQVVMKKNGDGMA